MTILVFKLVGGIGLFLLGMVLLTDGLKAFAGDALRKALVRFTGTPLKAFTSGALVTVMVQSSSATTVTVIGFVSAGLLAFPQAIGVVFGASLGTTGTGWIISGLGLKISMGFYALPLVGIGAFMKLLANGRWRSLGIAIAGFGLIFIGIETLQDAMRGLSGVFDLASLPAGGFRGHLLAMAIGIAMTVVMQSSSAAVATTLTALHTGVVSFEQAASLVIGAAIGTTVTGALAAIGGSVPAKRAALAHVVFNLATGLIAVVLLPGFLRLISRAQEQGWLEPGAMSLAAFHTGFIAVGVLVFLPFVHRFARAIERALPDRGPALTRYLDNTLLRTPAVALEATRRALAETAAETFGILRGSISLNGDGKDEARGTAARIALDRLKEFFSQIPPIAEDEPMSQLRVGQMHAIDHLTRLQSRLSPPSSVRHVLGHPRLQPAVELTSAILTQGETGMRRQVRTDWLSSVERSASELGDLRRKERPLILQQSVGADSPAQTLELLDAMRWLDRLGYHTWRICHYLGNGAAQELSLVDAHTDPEDYVDQ